MQNGNGQTSPRQQRNIRNTQNNANFIRNAAQAAKKTNHPVARGIGEAVDATDKLTGGKASQKMGQNLNKLPSMGGAGKRTPKSINDLSKNGTADAIGNSASSTNPPPSNNATISSTESLFGKGKGVKVTMSTLPFIGIGAGVFLFAAVFVTLLGAEVSAMEPSTIIEECKQVEVVNTQDNLYDGYVDLESYVAGAIAAKGHDTNNVEFYKVLAVKERSEMMQRMGNNCRMDEKNNSEPYIPVENSKYKSEINSAVNATRGNVLTDDGMIKNRWNWSIKINYWRRL